MGPIRFVRGLTGWVLLLSLTMMLATGCAVPCRKSSGGGGAVTPTPTATATPTPTPTPSAVFNGAIIKGPLGGATVQVNARSTAASEGTTQGTGTSATDGTFSVTAAGFSGMAFLKVSGGTYVDEATGVTRTNQTALTGALAGVTPGGTFTLNITPLTHAAVQRAIALGSFDAAALEGAAGEVAVDFGGFPIVDTLPASPLVAGTANKNASDYGLVLGGIAKLAQTLGVTPDALVDALARDFTDGALDGRAGTTAIIIGSTNLSTRPVADDLSNAILAFALSPQNVSGRMPSEALLFAVSQADTVHSGTAPIAQVGADQDVLVGATVTLSGSLRGTTATPVFTWSQLSGPAVTLSDPSAASPTFTASTAGVLIFQLAATAGGVSALPVRSRVVVQGTNAALNVRAVAASPTAISRNQALTLTVGVQNIGQNAANITAVSPSFRTTGGADVTPQFTVTASPGNPTTIAAGATASFTFNATPSGTAPQAALIADASATGTDAVNSTPTADPDAELPAQIAVLASPQLVIESFTVPASVNPGSTFAVTASVRNLGGAAGIINSVDLVFRDAGAVDRSSQYTIVPDPTNATSVAPGAQVTLRANVTLQSPATPGVITLDGSITFADAGGAVSTTPNATTSSTFTVTVPNTVLIASVTGPATLSQGQGTSIAVALTNGTGVTATLDSLTLTFRQGGTDVASSFTVTPAGGNPVSLNAGQSGTANFNVTVAGGAPTGATIVDAVLNFTVAGQARTEPGAASPLATTIQTPAQLVLGAVGAPVAVSRGQAATVTLPISNPGQARASVIVPVLRFADSGSTDRSSEYVVVPAGGNPAFLNGGANATYSFTVTVSPTATLGSITIDASVSGQDANSSAALSDAAAAATATWQVQLPAALVLNAVAQSPALVTQGQSFGVTLTAQNTGQAGANIVAGTSTPTFTGAGGANRAAFYTVVASAGNPTSIAGGASANLVYTVTAATNAPTENVTVDGVVNATDANSSGGVTSGPAASTASMTVQQRATFDILSTTAPTPILTGSTVTVTMTVNNPGAVTANVTANALSFSRGATNTDSDYVVVPVTAPATIPAGATVDFVYSVTINSTATAGLTTIDGSISGSDASTGLFITDGAATTKATWTFATPAVLSITSTTARASVTLGQSATVTMTVANTGGSPASIAGTALSFANGGNVTGEYNVVANPANPTSIALGTSADFTYTVTVSPTATLGNVTIDGSVSGTDQIFLTPVSDTGATTPAVWAVQSPPSISITALTAPPIAVQGQTTTVTVTVANTAGSAAAAFTGGQIFFTGTVPRDGEYSVSPAGGNPTQVAGGASANLRFLVTVAGTATRETVTLTSNVSATDANTGSPVSASGPAIPPTWDVVAGAAFQVTAITPTPATLSQGQTFNVTVAITNTGDASGSLTSVTPRFFAGPTDVGAEYLVSPNPGNPTTVNATSTANLGFQVALSPAATLGTVSLTADVVGVDSVSGGPANASGPAVPPTLNVQTPAAIIVDSVAVTPASVFQTESLFVTLQARNVGQATLNVTRAGTSFTTGGIDDTGNYVETPNPGNPLTLSGNSTATFQVTVSVGKDALTGITSIDGVLTGLDANSGAVVTDATSTVTATAEIKQLDNTGPKFLYTNPANGTINIQSNTELFVTFDRPVDPATVTTASFTVAQVTQSGLPVSTNVTVTSVTRLFPDRQTWKIGIPSVPLSPESTYAILLSNRVEDLAGNESPGDLSRFSTSLEPSRLGTAPPSFQTTQPAIFGFHLRRTSPSHDRHNVPDSSRIYASWRGPLNPATVNVTSVHLYDMTVPVTEISLASVVVTTQPTATILVTPSVPLSLNTTYGVVFSNLVKDSTGMPVPSQDIRFSTAIVPPRAGTLVGRTDFTTAVPDLDGPAFQFMNPDHGRASILENSRVIVTLSEGANPASLGAGNFRLWETSTADGATFNVTPVTISGLGAVATPPNSVEILPATSLNVSRTYVVAMDNRVLDASGNPGPGEDRAFSTEIRFDFNKVKGFALSSFQPTPDTTGPQLESSVLGTAGNSPCTPLQFLFTEAVAPGGLTTGVNVRLFTRIVDSGTGQELSLFERQTASVFALNNTMTVTPTTQLEVTGFFPAPSVTHMVVVNNRANDTTGNASPGESFAFQIDTAGNCCNSDLTNCCGPIVRAYNPPHGKLNVPPDSRVIVQFDLPIDSRTITQSFGLFTISGTGQNTDLCSGSVGDYPAIVSQVPCDVVTVPNVIPNAFEFIPQTNGGKLLPGTYYTITHTGPGGMKLVNGKFANRLRVFEYANFSTGGVPIPNAFFSPTEPDFTLLHSQIPFQPSGNPFYGPNLINSLPFHNRYNQRRSSRLFVTIGDTVDPTTVTTQSVVLQEYTNPPTPVALANVTQRGTNTWELVPAAALSDGTTYTMHLTNRVTALTGEPCPPDEVYFSTRLDTKRMGVGIPRVSQPTPDTTGPVFVASPVRKANVHANNRVYLQFDENVDGSTLTTNPLFVFLSQDPDQNPVTPIDLTRSVTSTLRPNLFEITPSVTFTYDTTYAVFATDNVKDASGNLGSGQETFFETRIDFPTFGRSVPSVLTTNTALSGPYIQFANPSNGRSGVLTESRILLTLSEPAIIANVTTGVFLRQLSAPIGDIPATIVSAAAPANTFEVVPSVPLASNTTYGVYLTNLVHDVSGQPSPTDEFFFQTQIVPASVGSQTSTTLATIPELGPIWLGKNPANLRFNVLPTTKLFVTFSETVDPVSLAGPNAVVVTNLTTAPFNRIPLAGPITAVPQPANTFEIPISSASLTPNQTYAVFLTNRVNDVAGNPSPGDSYQFSTTIDLASMYSTVPTSQRADFATFGPVLLDQSPPHAKVNVSPQSRILFRFNTGVANVSPATVALKQVLAGGATVDVPGTVNAVTPANTFEFVPSSLPLSLGTTYALFVTNGVRTPAGRQSPGDEFHFSTVIDTGSAFSTYTTTDRGIATNPPVLVSSTPSNGRMNVQTSTRVIFTFNRAMLDSTLNVTSVTLIDTTTPATQLAALSVVPRATPANSYELVLAPGTLTEATTYVVQINNNATAVDGTRCPGDEFQFSTSTDLKSVNQTVPTTERGNVAKHGPVLLSSNPANGEDNVSLNSRVLFTFNTPMSDATVTSTGAVVFKQVEGLGGEVLIPATVAKIPAPPNTYELTSSVSLTADTTYAVFVTNRAETPAGVPCPGDEFEFATNVTLTAANVPGAGQVFSNINPAPNRVNVMDNTRILATFDRPVSLSSLQANGIEVGIAVPGVFAPLSIASIVPVTTPANTFDIRMSAPLTPDTTFAVALNNRANDAAGNPLPAFFSTFGTAIVKSRIATPLSSEAVRDPLAFGPLPMTFNPTNSQLNILPATRMFVTFSGAVNTPLTTQIRLFAIEPGAPAEVPLASIVPVAAPPNTYEITSSVSLTADTSYAMFVTNHVRAPSEFATPGNDSFFSTQIHVPSIGSERYTTDTTSPDVVGPFIAISNPANQAFNVPIQSKLLVTFNESIVDDSITLNPTRSAALYQLTPSVVDMGSVVVTKESTPANTYQIALTPSVDLSLDTTYALFVTNNVEDVNGNHAQPGSVQFSTSIKFGFILNASKMMFAALPAAMSLGAGGVQALPALAVTQLILAERVAIGETAASLITVKNSGGTTISLTGTRLSFGGRDSDFDVKPNPANPTAVAAGQSVALSVALTPKDTAAGRVNVTAQVDGREPLLGLRLTGTSAVRAVDVVSPPRIASTLTVPDVVRAGQIVDARLTLVNAGDLAARLTSAGLTFSSPGFTAVRISDLPASLPPGGRLQLDFKVSVDTAPLERVDVTATASATSSSGAPVPVPPAHAAWLTGPSSAASLTPQSGARVAPGGLATDGRRIYLADTANDRVLVFDLATSPRLDRPAFSLTGFAGPTALACDGARLAVADTGNNRVLVWDALPTSATSAPSRALNDLAAPSGVTFVAGQLLVADTGHNRVLLYAPTTVRPIGQNLLRPTALLWDGTSLWIADTGNHRVLAWDGLPSPTAAPDATLTTGFSEPAGLATANGLVFVSDRAARSVTALSRDLAAARPLDTLKATPLAPFPGGPALTAPEALLALPGTLYVADPLAERVWLLGR